LNKVFDRSCFLFIQTNFLFKINQIEKNRQIYKGGSWCKWRGKTWQRFQYGGRDWVRNSK